MKTITLTHGKTALVDDEDYDYLNQWSWRALLNKNCNKWYAVRTGESFNIKTGKIECRMISMHRTILKLKDSNIYGDHIDSNSLNNQKNNLRIATPAQNSWNRSVNPKSYSKYIGVTYRLEKPRNKRIDGTYQKPYYIYLVRIMVNNKRLFIKQYKATPENEILAAKAYDEAALKYHGEFAKLNFK